MQASKFATIQATRVTVEFKLPKEFKFNWRTLIPSQEQLLHWMFDFAFVLFFGFCIAYAFLAPFTRPIRGEHLWGVAGALILVLQLVSYFGKAHKAGTKPWLIPFKLFDSKFRQEHSPGILGTLVIVSCVFIPAGHIVVKGGGYIYYYRPLISLILFAAVWGMTADMKYAPHPIHSLRDVSAFLGNLVVTLLVAIWAACRSMGKAIAGRTPSNVKPATEAKKHPVVESQAFNLEDALNNAMSGIRSAVNTIVSCLRIVDQKGNPRLMRNLEKCGIALEAIPDLIAELAQTSEHTPKWAALFKQRDFADKKANFLLILDGKDLK
jgi:hypothetical protein